MHVSPMWYLLSFTIPLLAKRFDFANKRCHQCSQPYPGPQFIHNHTKQSRFKKPIIHEIEIPLQCPQNIRNWPAVRLFLTKVESSIQEHCVLADNCNRPGRFDNQDRLANRSVYDYIVVGAGTAGSIIAGRLALESNKTVLLLEAGDADPIYSRVPAFYKYFRYHNDTDWKYKTKFSENYCKSGRGVCKLPRGKGLDRGKSILTVDTTLNLSTKRVATLRARGIWNFMFFKLPCGTSMYNDMIYLRGHPHDCENWFRSEGVSYTCSDFEGLYNKFENFLDLQEQEETPRKNDSICYKGNYGVEGTSPIQKFKHKHKLIERFIQAAQDSGFKYIEDLMDKDTLSGGVGLAWTFTGNGQRFTPARIYLPENQTNLLIVLKAHVNRVLFTGYEDRAYKVELVLNEDWNVTYYAEASEEIILCAGSINTPKILMLSGIGPGEELERLNISIVSDLPVGQYMKSHYGFRIRYAFGYYSDHAKKRWSSWGGWPYYLWENAMVYLYPNATMRSYIYADMLNNDSLKEYVDRGTGPLSSNGLTQLVGMFTSNKTRNKNKPDLQVIFYGFQADCSRTDKQNLTQAIKYYYPSHEGDRVFNGTGTRLMNGTPKSGMQYMNVDLNAFAGRKIDAYVLLLDPRSVGNITLNSSDPSQDPIIDPNYLDKEDDLEMLIDGGRIVDSIFTSKSMADLKMQMPITYFRPCSAPEYIPGHWKFYPQKPGYYYHVPFKNFDDNFYTCLVEHYTAGEYHQQGTASIGEVVDENFMVKGVTGLRVTDGSVIPTPVSGSPQGTIMMFAERSAELILRGGN